MTSLQPNKIIPYVLQHVLLAVNVNLVSLVISMAHVWQKMSVTLVALIKLSNHVEVIAVNQPVECQIVPIGTAIILALQDVNVMMDLSVISLATVSPKSLVTTHSAPSTKKLTHVTMLVRMSLVTTTISISHAQPFQHLNARADVNVKLDMSATAKESVLHQHHVQ